MKTYRKKPVEIQAWQLTPENVAEVATWCGGRVVEEAKSSDPYDVYIGLDIPTLEGVMRAEVSSGDYVIKGVVGEFYSCRGDVFEKTYEDASKALHSTYYRALDADGDLWVESRNPQETLAHAERAKQPVTLQKLETWTVETVWEEWKP